MAGSFLGDEPHTEEQREMDQGAGGAYVICTTALELSGGVTQLWQAVSCQMSHTWMNCVRQTKEQAGHGMQLSFLAGESRNSDRPFTTHG